MNGELYNDIPVLCDPYHMTYDDALAPDEIQDRRVRRNAWRKESFLRFLRNHEEI